MVVFRTSLGQHSLSAIVALSRVNIYYHHRDEIENESLKKRNRSYHYNPA